MVIEEHRYYKSLENDIPITDISVCILDTTSKKMSLFKSKFYHGIGKDIPNDENDTIMVSVEDSFIDKRISELTDILKVNKGKKTKKLNQVTYVFDNIVFNEHMKGETRFIITGKEEELSEIESHEYF